MMECGRLVIVGPVQTVGSGEMYFNRTEIYTHRIKHSDIVL